MLLFINCTPPLTEVMQKKQMLKMTRDQHKMAACRMAAPAGQAKQCLAHSGLVLIVDSMT
jgi:hypothetical protein